MKCCCCGSIGGVVRLACKLECCRESGCNEAFDQPFKALHHDGSEGYWQLSLSVDAGDYFGNGMMVVALNSLWFQRLLMPRRWVVVGISSYCAPQKACISISL